MSRAEIDNLRLMTRCHELTEGRLCHWCEIECMYHPISKKNVTDYAEKEKEREDLLTVSFVPSAKNGDLSCMVVLRKQADEAIIVNELLGDDAEYVYQLLLQGEREEK